MVLVVPKGLEELAGQILAGSCQREPSVLNTPSGDKMLCHILHDRNVPSKHQNFEAVLVIEVYVQA